MSSSENIRDRRIQYFFEDKISFEDFVQVVSNSSGVCKTITRFYIFLKFILVVSQRLRMDELKFWFVSLVIAICCLVGIWTFQSLKRIESIVFLWNLAFSVSGNNQSKTYDAPLNALSFIYFISLVRFMWLSCIW